jgi:outer membrane protein assembly factor BamA
MIGAFTVQEDASQRHRYLASVYYGPSSRRTWYSFDYFYEGFYPSLQFHTADGDTTHSGFLEDASGSKSYVERTRMIGGVVIVPLLKNATQQWLIVEYARKRISALTDLPPWTGYAGPMPAQGLLAAVRASYLFSSTREYAYSFGPEDGRKLEFGVERYDKAVGSDLDYTRYTADWHEYLDLPGKHQVLLARAFYGTSTGNGPPQGVFELGGDVLGDITTTLDDSYLSLRGYPPNVLRGRKAATGTLEYRFPIANLERGADTAPFFARRLHGALFVDAGETWDDSYRGSALHRSVGAELRMNITFSYYLPITLRLVAAKGLDEDGERQFYFSFWVPLDLFDL